MIKINEYTRQVQDALDHARQEVVLQMAQAQSARYTSVQAQEVALHDKVEAALGLSQALDSRKVAAAVEDLATEAKLLAGNLAASSAASTDAAGAAASAMSTAAASIKTAMAALEALTQDTSGVTTLIHSNDRGEKVDLRGQLAAEALKVALNAMNRFKSAAVAGNVIAAQSQAGTAANAFANVQKQVGEVVAAAGIQLTHANDLATKAVAERNRTAAFYSAQIDPRDQALDNVDVLATALKRVDRATEGFIGVKVVDGKAQLEVKYRPWDAEKAPGDLQFAAVKVASVPGFKYSSTGQQHWFPVLEKKGEAQAASPAPAPSHYLLTQDSENNEIAFGQSYCVFATWTRKSVNAEGDPVNVRVLTVPSAPVLVHLTGVPSPEAPGFARLAAGGFVLAIREPANLPAGSTVERRLFIVPGRLHARKAVDQLMLASRANPSSYLSCLEPKQPENPETVATSVAKLNWEEAGREKELQPMTEEHIRDLIKKIDDLKGSTLVYFSPVAENKPGLESGGAYYLGSYTDAFGEPIDLDTETYTAAVVYVLSFKKTQPANAQDLTQEADPSAGSAEMFLSKGTQVLPTKSTSSSTSTPK